MEMILLKLNIFLEVDSKLHLKHLMEVVQIMAIELKNYTVIICLKYPVSCRTLFNWQEFTKSTQNIPKDLYTYIVYEEKDRLICLFSLFSFLQTKSSPTRMVYPAYI